MIKIPSHKPSFIYFDLGGVVIRDFSGTNKWTEFKKELGLTLTNDQKFENFWKKYEAEVCIGRDIETLIPIIKEKFKLQIPHSYSLLNDGFINRFEANKSIWPTIYKFRQYCKIGLLTNMFQGMFTAIKNKSLLPDIPWDVIIDSSVAGVQKPDPKIFKLAQKAAHTNSQEILFIDNSPQNINAAQLFGWQTYLYDSAHPEKSNRKLLNLCDSLFD